MAQAEGCAADPDVLQCTRLVLMQELVGLQLQMMDFTVQQLGRMAFVVVYINPLQLQKSRVIDGLCHPSMPAAVPNLDVPCSLR